MIAPAVNRRLVVGILLGACLAVLWTGARRLTRARRGPSGTSGPAKVWGVQYGEDYIVFGSKAACSPEGVPYVVNRGSTQGSERIDCFVESYSPADGRAVRTWFETTGYERLVAAMDGRGNMYVAGRIRSDHYARSHVVVTKLSPEGAVLWKRETECPGYNFRRIVVGDGGVYVVGTSTVAGMDAMPYVIKLGHNGERVWEKLTRAKVTGGGCSADCADVDQSGNFWIAGVIGHGSRDNRGYIAKVDSGGRQLWWRRLSLKRSMPVVVRPAPGGGVYIGGAVPVEDRRSKAQSFVEDSVIGHYSPFPPAAYVGFVCRYDSRGKERWLRYTEAGAYDSVNDLTLDRLGNVYAAGSAIGSASLVDDGSPSHAFVAKLTSSGKLVWRRNIDSGGRDEASGVAVDRRGNVYVCGYTYGSLFHANAGTCEGFLVKFAQPKDSP